MSAPNHNSTAQTNSALSPATRPSWRFGDLPAAELMSQLQRHLLESNINANWQLIWLNNDGHPVIGLLPKTSWSVYYNANNDVILSKKIAIYNVVKHCRDVNIHIDFDSRGDSSAITTTQMSYAEWQNELIAYSQAYSADGYNINSHVSNLAINADDKPTYYHGLIGFIGYDIAARELSSASNIHLATQPCAVLGHYDICLIPKTNADTGWQLVVNTTANESDKNTDNTHRNWLINMLISYLDALDKKLSQDNLSQKNTHQVPSETISKLAPLLLQARWRKRDYEQAFNQTQNYLQQGDCYQINLTQEWRGSVDNNLSDSSSLPKLIDYLPALHANTQAPFAGYLVVEGANNTNETNTPKQQFELLSCSPELFFTFIKDPSTGEHHIITKPIKGTMPRGVTAKLDDAYKQQLIASEKDRAENVMIVDLLRNDLGKYAKIGSVKVPQLFAIESFSNVHHMVSTISAELKKDTHPLAVLFGSLPAGSITGTPKKRAVEIISQLEIAPRGAYCGTMGYMNFDGTGQWSVLIRTLQASRQIDKAAKVSLWAGGGITVASDCEAEYQECLDKVGNLLAILGQENISR